MERYNGYYFTAKNIKGQWIVNAYLDDSLGTATGLDITKAMEEAVKDCRLVRRLRRHDTRVQG